jgi:N-acetyl sugar amidotransferase
MPPIKTVFANWPQRTLLLDTTTIPTSPNHQAPTTPPRQCAICVLDTNDDPEMTFDENGISNYFREYHEKTLSHIVPAHERDDRLKQLVTRIRNDGKNSNYDCIVGVSGGVDSSFVALKAKSLGLRVLAVHLDNGWNSELAVQNITNIVQRLKIDLHTTVLDWGHFRDLQSAYLHASVIDVEVPTDHAIAGTVYRAALKYKVKHILSGNNFRTECTMPIHWNFNKLDHVNLKAIYRQYSNSSLGNYPLVGFWLKQRLRRLQSLETTYLLDLIEYEKEGAKQQIADELGWRDYGGKHYESIFTRFYQGFILPEKFGVDKRKAHLSDLIFAGQMTKNDALKELTQPIYDPDVFKNDYPFFLKKMGYSDAEFTNLLSSPQRKHSDFPIECGILARMGLRPVRESRSGDGTVRR